MSDYSLARHANALDKADQSPSAALKGVYLQLADHYLSLHRASSPSRSRPGEPSGKTMTASRSDE